MAVRLDDENRGFDMAPLATIERWLDSHDLCARAEVKMAIPGGSTSFTAGSLGDLKRDALLRVRQALATRHSDQRRAALHEL